MQFPPAKEFQAGKRARQKRNKKVDFIGFFLQTMSYTGAATLKRESC
jgi:hypothetical protein